jgi:hypothetical protein
VNGERGSTPVELALGIALLVLPVMVLVLVIPIWVERQGMARTAAQEAARAAVVHTDQRAADAAARQAAAEVVSNRGYPQEDLAEVEVTGRLTRGGLVTATVHVRVPLVRIPGLGSVGGFTISAAQTEPVDAFRSTS